MNFKCYGNLIVKVDGNEIFEGFCCGDKFLNLTPGFWTFETDGIIPEKEFTEFKRFTPFKLPKKDYDNSGECELFYDKNNHSPASIDVEKRQIFVNDEFMNLPFYSKMFILSHEIGHLLYDDELSADIYAFNECLKNGIPVSMCFATHEKILSTGQENQQRKKQAYEIAKQINKQLNNN